MFRTHLVTIAVLILATPAFAEEAIDPFSHTEFDSGLPVGPIDAAPSTASASGPTADASSTQVDPRRPCTSSDKS